MTRQVVLLGLLIAALHGTLFSQDDPARPLHIHYLDMGQGDAIVIAAPTGQHVLVDAGPGRGIVDHLKRLEVDTIDLFIASHNHADHIGGAAAVIQNFPIRFFMDNGVAHTTVTYRNLMETLLEAEVPLLEPEHRTIDLGRVTLEILPPPGDPELGHNDNSIGVVLRYGRFRATFMGDAGPTLWDQWLEQFPSSLTAVHVHKASHHGSRLGDTPQALALLAPELVIVSAGRDNQYGHPHTEAVQLYKGTGAQILSTAEHGTITVAAGHDGSYSVLPFNQPCFRPLSGLPQAARTLPVFRR